MKKAISFKNNLNKKLDREYKDQKTKLGEEGKEMEHPAILHLNPAYEKKMRSKWATYFHSLMASTSEEEMARRPDWYRGLSLPLPEGAILVEEGGEIPNLPIEEDHPAKP
ncbi:hypothetical protein LIER_38192 [Lithospermum erythrorhizon]|uniref:Uncharacterized protein n=1 Tax=Lithospermum erythrorhizon TaxID=34254 RepID=A0AAV3PYG5_LITER